ncbi:hypothetical protein [Paenibacillus ferrarius]
MMDSLLIVRFYPFILGFLLSGSRQAVLQYIISASPYVAEELEQLLAFL